MNTNTRQLFFQRILRMIVLVFVFMSAGSLFFPALAQSGSADWSFNGSGGSDAVAVVGRIREAMHKVLFVILVLAALSSLLMATYNMMQGEQGAAKRMFIWVLGLSIGIVFLQVISSLTPEVRYSTHSFSAIRQTVGGVLAIAMSIVCMVTLVVVIIHVMNGERDGVQKLLKWLFVSAIGYTLFSIV